MTWVTKLTLIGSLCLAALLAGAKFCCHKIKKARRASARAARIATTVADAYATVLRGHDPPALPLPPPEPRRHRYRQPRRRPLILTAAFAATVLALAFTGLQVVSPGTGHVVLNVPEGGVAAPPPPSAPGPGSTSGDPTGATTGPGRGLLPPAAPGDTMTSDDPPADTSTSSSGGGSGDGDATVGRSGGTGSDGETDADTPTDPNPGDDGGGSPPTASPPPDQPDDEQPPAAKRDPLLACVNLLRLLELCI